MAKYVDVEPLIEEYTKSINYLTEHVTEMDILAFANMGASFETAVQMLLQAPAADVISRDCYDRLLAETNAPYYETVIADRETGVMYLVIYAFNHCGITPLLDADGTPLTICKGGDEE